MKAERSVEEKFLDFLRENFEEGEVIKVKKDSEYEYIRGDRRVLVTMTGKRPKFKSIVVVTKEEAFDIPKECFAEDLMYGNTPKGLHISYRTNNGKTVRSFLFK